MPTTQQRPAPQTSTASDKLLELLHAARASGRPIPAEARNLKGRRLVGADLSGLNLSGCDLSEADLSRADLSGAKLMGCNLQQATLFQANLTGAKLMTANLSGANLTECEASGAGLSGAVLVDAVIFGANLVDAALTCAVLQGADLRTARLDRACLAEADLRGANLSQASLVGARLEQCNVRGAFFRDANLERSRIRALVAYDTADWLGTRIPEVDFSGAYLVRRVIADQNYLHEFRSQSKASAIVYWIWWATSDCGRSFLRWGLWICFLAIVFAGLFEMVNVDYGDHPTPLSPFYYSVVTLTTLGYGDVTPASTAAQILALIEVVLGYVMLGGLLSIFANKMARRAD